MILSELYLPFQDYEQGKSSRVQIMSDPVQRASDFRRYAALCSNFADRMSVPANRDRMMEMAQRFLELAQKEEAIAR
jgi:hypothetical protein